ncbi:MAG: IclR family transcriptional regulator [Halobacteriota archaeon]
MHVDWEPRGPVETDKTVLRILTTIKTENGATVTDVAETLEMSKSTVHRHLTTLEASKYVVNRGGQYELGLRFLDFGRHAQTNRPIYPLAESRVQELAEKTGEAAWCVVEEHGYAVYLCHGTTPQAVKTHANVGKWEHLHTLAAGKAILAHLPRDRVEAIVDTVGLPARTAQTITDWPTLRAELDRIRSEGIAFNDGETIPNVRAVGVPVLQDGEPIGALSVAGPKKRLIGDVYRESIPNTLLGTANEIELRLAYPDE